MVGGLFPYVHIMKVWRYYMLMFALVVLFLLSSFGFSITENEMFAILAALLIGAICVSAESLI